jgi:lysophospholipase L1-like esterase
MLNVKSSLKDNIAIQGVVKPGALTNILVNSARNEINGLSKKDMVVICGGTNDISINNSTMALHQIRDFVENNTHTNIALLTAPPRHDLM